jgi:16S rRNA (guanine966-N2)-methyltransferase
MRVIAGESRGRRLKAPRGRATRPASIRVRNSIFSRLAARTDFRGTRVLDLFAGSGSLGIEALSRGAARVTFVDSSRAAAASIERNLETLGLSERAMVIASDVNRAVAELGGNRERFDLVFIDAPYRTDTSAELLERLANLELIDRKGFVVVHQFWRRPAPVPPTGLDSVSVVTIGDHRIALYRPADGR